MRGMKAVSRLQDERGPSGDGPFDLALGRWIGATIVSVGVSITASLVLDFVGLPATSPLSLLAGLVCGSLVAGYFLEARSVRRWAAAFGAVLLAELIIAFEIIGIFAWFGGFRGPARCRGSRTGAGTSARRGGSTVGSATHYAD